MHPAIEAAPHAGPKFGPTSEGYQMSVRVLSARRMLVLLLAFSGAMVVGLDVRGDDTAADGELVFNGKDFTGWNFVRQKGKELWSVVGDVKLDPSNPKRLIPSGSGTAGPQGIMFRDGQDDSGGQEGT